MMSSCPRKLYGAPVRKLDLVLSRTIHEKHRVIVRSTSTIHIKHRVRNVEHDGDGCCQRSSTCGGLSWRPPYRSLTTTNTTTRRWQRQQKYSRSNPITTHSLTFSTSSSSSSTPSDSTSSPPPKDNNDNNNKTPPLPLSGLKILDLSRVLAGPFATQILSDYGATVLKIEQPPSSSSSQTSSNSTSKAQDGGDETRRWRTSGETTSNIWKPTHSGQISLYFCAVNRNKRSLTLNLKSPTAKDIIRKLIVEHNYDVVVHNFLPGTMEKLGLGYDVLRRWNRGVIFAEVSGYGASGPLRARSGYDAIAAAEAGLLHITGEEEGPPVKPGVAIADLCTGLYVHGAILAAVNQRRGGTEVSISGGNSDVEAEVRKGQGCKIEGSLFESAVSLLINVGLASLNLDVDKGKNERRRGKRFGAGHPNLVPYNRYQTKDGRFLFIAANNDRQWKMLGERVGLSTTLVDAYNSNDKRVESREKIDQALNDKFAEHDMKYWLHVFEGSGLPYGAINDVVEALEEHPQAAARDMVLKIEDFEAAMDGVVRLIGPAVKFSGVDPKKSVRLNPPLLGEHTEQVLVELGYSLDEVEQFKKEGVV